MNRKHLILPAALLAGSALLGGRAAIGALPLGTDAQPAAAVGQLVETTSPEDIALRTSQLDAAEQRINALAGEVPPPLPAVPAAPIRVASPSAGPSSSASPSIVARSDDGGGSSVRTSDDDDDHEFEDDDRYEDHGGDDDDHGDSDDD